MRNMSFQLTTAQILDGRKTVTRRITPNDVVREGFRMTTEDFIRMFCETQRCYPSTFVTRIEFEIERYLDGRGQLNLFESKGTT